MKQIIDSLPTPEEIFCKIISNLNEKNEIKIISNILSYLSPKEIVLISFNTTEKLKKIMTENENPFLPSYLKNIYISKKSPQNFLNLNLFRNQIDYFSILMDNRIFEISSYFNMKHIYCKCNETDFITENKQSRDYDWDNSFCWVLKDIDQSHRFHSKTDIFDQEKNLIQERKSANLWKRSLKKEILAPINQNEKNHVNINLAAFILLCIDIKDFSIMFDNLSKLIFFRMIGKRLFHKEFKIFSEGIFDANVLVQLTHEKEFLDFFLDNEENSLVDSRKLQDKLDLNYENFEKNYLRKEQKQFETTLFTEPCLVEKTFTGYFGYSDKVFDGCGLGEMFKNIIIFRNQKTEMKIYKLWKKCLFRMINSDFWMFDRNQNNTTILANDTYFDNLIEYYEEDEYTDLYFSILKRPYPQSIDYTEELETLANFFIKKNSFLKNVLIEAVNLRMYENSGEPTELEQINWICNLNFSNFFVDNRTWEERCLAFWNYKKTNREKKKKNKKKYPYAFNGEYLNRNYEMI